MKAIVYEGNNTMSIKDVAKPVLENDEVLIKVVYGAICPYEIRHPRIQPPMIPGHEFCGEIEEINSQNNLNLQVGDRVAVKPTISCGYCEACQHGFFHICQNLGLLGIDTDGGFAEYVKVPIDNALKVSKKVDYKEIALIEPLSIALHAVRRSSFKVGDNVVILGGGPIGLLTASILRLAGASQIMITEINPFRLKMIKELGFQAINVEEENVRKKVKRATDGIGVDILFEATGVQSNSKRLINLTRFRGEIILIGLFEKPVTINFQNFSFKEQNIIGVRLYTREDIKKAIKLLENKQIDLKPFVTNKMNFEEINKGLEMVRNKDETIKILISP